jgi:predicted RecB family nuclease
MQYLGGRVVYSATDLYNYLECGHLVALERQVALGNLGRPERDPQSALVADKGLLHERRYLEALRGDHAIVEIEQAENTREAVERAAAETIAAMERGDHVIYQGTFFDGEFLGRTDFLLRVETPSARWAWSYEVADTKLSLHDKPYFIIQLCHYSEHVGRVQGRAPERMHIVLGDLKQKHFRVDDFAAYYRHLKASFLSSGASSDAYPFKCEHCNICDWAPRCEQQRADDDHLSIVARMRRDQIKKFESAGIAKVAALASADSSRPLGLNDITFDRLRRQAALQVRGRESGQYHYEFLDHRPVEGFGLMPMPAKGDVFFDMEGDPLFEIGVGLEYLFGCYCPDDDQPFRPFWGISRADEKSAFERCVDFLVDRRKQYPTMHVYHYAPYEKTALQTLAQRHATREDEVDDLLRGDVLVDLYAVVRQSMLISQSSYSIKDLEPFYGMTRTTDVRRGSESVVMFETWLNDQSKSEILKDIERYNEQDCRSTFLLREWLLKLRQEYQTRRGIDLAFRPLREENAPCHSEPVEGCKECAKRVREQREATKISADQAALLAREHDRTAVQLGHLLSYHRREEKPAWWAYYYRCENTDELLEFDKEAIGGLELCREVKPLKEPGARNWVYTYRFPKQLHHVGDSPHDPFTRKGAGQIVSIDEERNVLELKRAGTLDEAEQVTALIPGAPVRTIVQKESLGRIAAEYLKGSLAARHPATIDILHRSYPRLSGRRTGEKIQPAIVSVESVFEVVKALENSYLFVQGPPGTGKTRTGARVIAKLIADGRKIGVMANSHKAIHNLLHAIEGVAHAEKIALHGLHKHSKKNTDSAYVSRLDHPLIESDDDNAASQGGNHNLISGTAWLFAREEMTDQVDYLFIDEAGQISLADAIAVSPSARNVVFLGDPMQLAQVSLGTHPESAASSALEHLLGDAATVAVDRGILLDTSYRMHPQICSFISSAFYDGRLRSDPPTANNRVESHGLTGAGLRFIAVEHVGNTRESAEEANRIVQEIDLLLRGTVARKFEPPRRIGTKDILVVTPYNAQRKRISAFLKAAGHEGVQVGTVDKFQGQEAPVVFYSMATSSGDDLPRTMEFLFEKNRFNVAVSRAECLSIVVCSPRLLDVRCNHTEHIALVNLLCRFAEAASAPRLSNWADTQAEFAGEHPPGVRTVR